MTTEPEPPVSRVRDTGRLLLAAGAVFAVFAFPGLGNARSGSEMLGMLSCPASLFLAGGILCAIGRAQERGGK